MTTETPKPGNDTGLPADTLAKRLSWTTEEAEDLLSWDLPDPIEALRECARELWIARHLKAEMTGHAIPATCHEAIALVIVAKHDLENAQ